MAKKKLKTITYNPTLGKIVARGVNKPNLMRFHVISSISDSQKWSLMIGSSPRSIGVFSSQNAAVNFAKKYESRRKWLAGEIVIHRKDGQIQDKIHFRQKEAA